MTRRTTRYQPLSMQTTSEPAWWNPTSGRVRFPPRRSHVSNVPGGHVPPCVTQGTWVGVLLAVLVATLQAAPSLARECILLPAGSEWRYLDGGAIAPAGWQAPAFNDDAWPLDQAHFGYGEGDEITELDFGGITTNKVTTYYFRTQFIASDLTPFDQLNVNIVADDGAVLYFNGAEVLRDNMPTGVVDSTTFAASSRSSPTENNQVFYALPISSIVAGTNTVAVELHQRSLTSSDLSFDLELVGQPFLESTLLLPYGSTWRYLDDGVVVPAGWQTNGFNDTGWDQGPAQLGYGDLDEATVINFGPDALNRAITYYFRAPLVIADPSAYAQLGIRLVADDGAVLYINGVEAVRDNLPAGSITPATHALFGKSTAIENDATLYTVPIAAVTAGTNQVAVEVHQSSSASSDLSFDLAVIGIGPATDPLLTREPFLQQPAPDQMTLCWRTQIDADSQIQYGTDISALNQSATQTNLTTDHVITLTNLLPATRYYYSVGTTTAELAGNDANHFFITPPPTGTAAPTRIWAIGSAGTGDIRAENVAQSFETRTAGTKVDLMLTLGDQAIHGGTQADMDCSFFEVYAPRLRHTTLWPVLGNRDNDFRDGKPYFDTFHLPTAGESGGTASNSEKFYSFDHANIHFICLDSVDSVRTPGSAMLTWLAADFAANTQTWTIAYMHFGPYSKGESDSDSETRATEMRTHSIPILEANGVDLVLGAQSASYERSMLVNGFYATPTLASGGTFLDSTSGDPEGTGFYAKSPGANQGTVYAIVGSSGKARPADLNHPVMHTSQEQRGSLIIDVNENLLTGRFLTDSNTVTDTFMIVKGAPSPFNVWRLQHFNGVLPTVPLTGEGDDFENDGVSNLVEYGTGQIPTAAEPSLQPTILTSGSNVALQYRRDTSKPDVTLIVEGARLLPGDDWSTTEVTDALISTAGDIQTRQGTLPASTEANGFLRLRATRP